MDRDVEEVLRILDGLEAVPTGPVELSPEYLRAVARIEERPENQDGSDKSWVWELQETYRLHLARARQID
jgi:hypothetical protein